MRRRRLLALLGGSAGTLSGCAGVGELGRGSTDDDVGDLTPAPVPNPTERASPETDEASDLRLSYTADLETANRRLALPVRSTRVYSDSRLELGFEQPLGSDAVVLLRGRLSNESLSATTAELGLLSLFQGNLVAKHAGDSDATVTLVPTGNDELAEADLPTDGVDAGACRADDEALAAVYPENVYLEPGEVRSVEFRVCPGAAEFDLPTGRYEFEETEGDDDRPVGSGPRHFLAWNPTEPGPTDASTFDDPTPPSFPERDVAWFHAADRTTPIWYRPSEERVTPPETVEFALSNRSAKPIPFSWDNPRLFKLVDGSWQEIAHRGESAWGVEISGGSESLVPGATNVESLCLAHGRQSDCEEGIPGVGHLGGGRYAAVADLGEGYASRAALVDVDAPPVAVEPNEDVTVRERTDGTVHLELVRDEATREGATDEEVTGEEGFFPDVDPHVVRVVVERVDAAERRLLPEQVMQPEYAALRNTLPFFESGVDRVELRAEANPLRYGHPVGSRSRRFVFEGDAYEVQIDR